jgi:hypothetical protein
MDQLQEDMENMHKELNFWSGERTQYSAMLLEAQKATKQELASMEAALKDVDDQIAASMKQTNSVKAQVDIAPFPSDVPAGDAPLSA